MAERIVLMFAYHFPPENAIGGTRPYCFYKYLSEMGYRCQVFTAADQGHHSNLGAEYIPDPFLTSPRGIGWQGERAVRKLLFPGVAGFQWSRLARQAASACLASRKNAEITIYSTFPPLGAHLAALFLAQKSKLKWIADFRDPLGKNPGQPGLTRFQQFVHDRLEKLIVNKADLIIVNTDALAQQWRRTYSKVQNKIHLIWNGFDAADRIEEVPLPQRTFKLFSHIGALYGGRNISPLLESIARLIQADRLAGNIRVRLVGPVSADCIPGPEFLAQAKNHGWLEIIPYQVPHHEARRIAQESDGLLLIQPHSTIQVPGKLFEYMRLRRPIFAFILPDSPIERLLKQGGVSYNCTYVGSTSEGIDSSLESFFNRKEVASETNIWFEENFDAKKQTESLDGLIQALYRQESQIS